MHSLDKELIYLNSSGKSTNEVRTVISINNEYRNGNIK